METKKLYHEYHYHVEDGQFSFDFAENKLLGDEGDIIKIYTDRSGDEKDEIYILFVEGNYVECVGDIERRFPINWNEHMELRKHEQKQYKNQIEDWTE